MYIYICLYTSAYMYVCLYTSVYMYVYIDLNVCVTKFETDAIILMNKCQNEEEEDGSSSQC